MTWIGSMMGEAEDLIATWNAALIEDSYIHVNVQCDGCQQVCTISMYSGELIMKRMLICYF